MADLKISELPAATTPSGTEQVPVVQAGGTVRTTIAAIIASALDRANHTGTQSQSTISGLVAALAAKAADAAVVKLTGNQTKDGVLTLTSAPVVPNGSFTIAKTAGLQAALDAIPVDGSVIHTTGDETKNGVLTFVDSPIVPTPVGGTDAANRDYVDTAITVGSGVRVEDEGSTVVAVATGLNFAGAGVTVTDAGSGEALVTINQTSSPGTAYVATPTGIDHTALVATARTAAGVGGTVVFPPGYTYLVDGLAASVADQHWVIMPGATVKTKDAADTPTIDVTADGVTIDGGGTIDGNRANQSDGTTGVNSCVRIVSRTGVKVRDLTMVDSLSHCVYIDASHKVQIRNNEISGCGPTGNQKQVLVYDTVGSSSDIRISGNTIDSTASTNGCIAITTSVAARTIRKVRITGNYCIVGDASATATLGIELFTSGTATISDAVIKGNVIEGAASATTDNLYGISIGGTASNAANGIHVVACVGNTVRNCPTAAIEIVGNTVTCTGNSCTASGAISVNAVSTTGGLVGVSVTGNTLTDCVNLAYAIFLEGGSNGLFGAVVSGNTIRGAASASTIATAGTISGAVISDNTVTGSDGVAVNLGGTFTDSTISGNVFDLTGVGGTIDGILIGSTSVARVGINNNTIRGASRNGIYGLVATSDISVVGNRITDCDNGLKTDDVATRWTVVANTITDNTDRGLIFATAGVDLAIASNTIEGNPGGDYYTTGSTFLTHVINGAGG